MENIRSLCLFQELVKGKGALQGKIIRPMRIVDPNQEEYAGLIQLTVESKLATRKKKLRCKT